jgi:hypothetical protein
MSILTSQQEFAKVSRRLIDAAKALVISPTPASCSFRFGSSCDQSYHSVLVSSRAESRHTRSSVDGKRTAAAEGFADPRHLVNCTDVSQTRRPARFGVEPALDLFCCQTAVRCAVSVDGAA